MATESLIIELDAKTGKLNNSLKSTENRLDKLEDQTKKTGVALKEMVRGVTVAATAAAAAVTAVTASAVNFARELEVAAARAGTTVERMQALAFASQTVGISLEKLGDIGKDVNEKIGEFLVTGGGGFQDFADVLKLSSSEAREAAKSFSQLSSDQALIEIVSQLERGGASSQEMSFALEGLASDATDLIPLLRDGAEQLSRLNNEFESLGVTLSQDQIDRIKLVGEEFSKLKSTFGAEGRALVAEYSEELIAAINAIETLATKTIDAFNLISTGWGNLVEISQAAISDLINGTDTLASVIEERTQRSQDAINELFGNASDPLEILITGGVDGVKKSVKEEKRSLQERASNFKNYIQAANQINNGFLEENKAIKAGLIVADTAAAVMLQLSSGDPYTAFSRAALAAAVGATQLANVLSSGKGGGNISEGSTGGGTSNQPAQQDFQPETDTLDFRSSTAGGSTTQTITFAADTGDSLVDAIAEALNNKMIRE